MKTGFQVIGHYKTLAPEHISSRTISDGTLFHTRHDAERYAAEKMHPGATVKEIDEPTRPLHIPREFRARRSVSVQFKDESLNFPTEANGTVQELKEYFIGTVFNLGTVADDCHRCTGLIFHDFS